MRAETKSGASASFRFFNLEPIGRVCAATRLRARFPPADAVDFAGCEGVRRVRNGMMLVFEVPGEIAGKQRVAQSGRRRFKSTKDRRGENVIAAYARQIAPQLPWREAVGLSVVIRVGVPRSWSKSRQRAAVSGLIRPTAKPDWDNTAKLICDACTGIIWHDDAQIVDASVSKFYGAPGATISVWQVIEGKEVLEAGNCEKEGSFDERSL